LTHYYFFQNQLEENNQSIFIHKLEIRSLKDQVIKLLEEAKEEHAQLQNPQQMMMQNQVPMQINQGPNGVSGMG
jgi:hypothetical protein